MPMADAMAIVMRVRDEVSEDGETFQVTVEYGDFAFHQCSNDWSDSAAIV
jgi:hypothetical protein